MGHARYLNVRCHHVTVSQPTGGNSPDSQGSLRRVSGSWAWRRGRLLPEGGRTGRDASAIRMGDTTCHAMAFAEGDIDNHGRFEPLPADMKPYGSGADIDAACAPVLPPDAYYTGRPGHTPMRSRCGTRPARSATAWPASGVDATGWNWSAQFGGLGYDGDLDLYTVNGMVGGAFGYLPGAELLLTGWPVPRRASPLPMLSRSGSRSWEPFRRRSSGAAARPQCQAPSRAGREVPTTRSDSSVIIAMAEAPGAYPVNLIDEYDGTVLVTSPDFPELTPFGAVRADALAHAVGAFAETNRRGIHAPMDVPAPTPTVIVRTSQR